MLGISTQNIVELSVFFNGHLCALIEYNEMKRRRLCVDILEECQIKTFIPTRNSILCFQTVEPFMRTVPNQRMCEPFEHTLLRFIII